MSATKPYHSLQKNFVPVPGNSFESLIVDFFENTIKKNPTLTPDMDVIFVVSYGDDQLIGAWKESAHMLKADFSADTTQKTGSPYEEQSFVFKQVKDNGDAFYKMQPYQCNSRIYGALKEACGAMMDAVAKNKPSVTIQVGHPVSKLT